MLIRPERYLDGCRQPFLDTLPLLHGYAFDRICEFYQHVTPTLTDAETRLLGCVDRYFLLTTLLHRRDAVHPWVYARCREVEANPDGYLDLWARFHYKSSIITFAGNIQDVLIDPEITIAIFAATKRIAQPFLVQIMQEFEINDRLIRLYEDVLYAIPKQQARTWSKAEGIVVKRKGNPKEPTIGAYGLIDGMPTAMHFKKLVYDDLITVDLVGNEDMIRKTTERFEMSDNLGVGGGTRKQATGTRYSFGDSYGILIERGVFQPRVHTATHNDKLTGNPVMMTKARWEEVKRTQRSTVAAQMLQNPLAGKDGMFDPHTLRPYTLRPRTLNIYILGDYAASKSKTADSTALLAIGIDHAGNKYLLDGYCHKMRLTERWMNLRNLYNRWEGATGVQSIRVGYEKYGAQSDIEHFKTMMQEKDEPEFPIDELNWARELSSQSKPMRVGRLEPDFASSKFYVPAKVWVPNAKWLDADGVEHEGPRICLWSVDEETGKMVYRPLKLDPKRAMLPHETRDERDARAVGENYRLIEAIRRRDENNDVYDLTRMFFEQFLFFPFSPHDDLIDCMSRIYDIEPEPAIIINREDTALPVYVD